MGFEGTKGGSDYSTGTDEHDTPPIFFDPVSEAVGGFDLDPCASNTSGLAETNLTADDGGLRDWWGKVYMNPPYSDVSDWMDHAAEQASSGNTDLIVALVFARTSTQWFHNHAVTADMWCFIEGRLSFGDADNSAPAPSVVCVWGDSPDDLRDALASKGVVVESWQKGYTPG